MLARLGRSHHESPPEDRVAWLARATGAVPRVIQIDQHNDARFRGHAGQRNEADRSRDRSVVAEWRHEQQTAHQRKGSESVTISVSVLLWKLKWSSNRIRKSVAGTTSPGNGLAAPLTDVRALCSQRSTRYQLPRARRTAK